MVDEPTPLPSEFGLTRTLPSSLDESLILSASARCNEYRDQWLGLMAQSPQSILDGHWWGTRARGTDVSRRTLAMRLYHQHFESSSQLAFAQGRLTVEQIKSIQTLIDPAIPTTTPEAPVIRVERLTLKSANDTRIELAGALVITRDTVQPAAQMLYLPSRPVAWMIFQDRNDMQRWLIGHQQQLVAPSGPGVVSIDYAALENTPLTGNADFLLTHLSTAQVSQSQRQAVFAQAADPSPTDPNEVDDQSLFGLLNPDIPLDERRSALTMQHAALESLFDTSNASLLPVLKQQLDALTAAEQSSATAASTLLNTRNPLSLLELRNLPNPHYTALYQARLAGLRAEADVQLTLKQISAQEHQWLKTVLDAPDKTDQQANVAVARITLVAADVEGTSTPALQELEGVLLFTHPSALLTDAPHGLLLYWPGHFGGLQRFDSLQTLQRTVFRLTAGENTLALRLSALSRDPIEYSLQTQLYACEQQAARIIADNSAPQRADQRIQALEKLREQTLASLTVPIPAARELAYTQLLEQHRSGVLASNLPQWLGTLSEAQRSRLKGLFTAYIKAMKRSHELLERDLPPREAFAEKAIDIKLRQEFGLTQRVEVLLDLPDSTYWQKIVMEGAAPGTPQQNMLFANQQRSKLSLAELALSNIDEAMWLRLTFMRVEINGADEAQRQMLQTGITQAWLRARVTELDLAGQYETLIRKTFLGSGAASTFSNEHRRECLSEPWRLMLKLQGEFALLQRQISVAGHRLLEIAIDANSREAYAADGKRIVLLPVNLTVGGEDTPHQGSSTLAGVTFIEEQISGLTLLYLPDSPDGVFLRQYDSLEEARKALFNLCLRTQMVNYLAGRAIHGNFEHHVSRINQALLKNFDAMIGTGMAWPATTSLAAHLLNVHMGRLLEAHRTTSRSNDALYLERAALKCGALFNYLKMALGMVPFVGTAIALYDAWNSANLAVGAFLRGEVGHGLAEVEATLLSLIDAALDILPGGAAGSSPAATARSLTRVRQLGTTGNAAKALRPFRTIRHARQVVERFAGYEYENLISLAGLQPGTHGIYRNVYRHADGDFMISQGRIYRIELSDGRRGWRLSGTRTRSYKQPIALDEAGNWNTHYAVYGTVIEGGGAGGGAVLGHMADGMDPLWPAAIRRWLPRWWTDRTLRRQLTLNNTVDAYTRRLDRQTRSTNDTLRDYFAVQPDQQHALRARADTACANDIDVAQTLYRNVEELMSLSHGRKRVQLSDLQSRCAWVATDRCVMRTRIIQNRLVAHLDRVDQLLTRSDTTPITDTATHLQLMAQRKEVRKDFLEDFERLRDAAQEANYWNSRITNRTQKTSMAPDMAVVNKTMGDANYHYLKTAHVLEIIARYDAVQDLSWVYFHVQLKKARSKVGRTLLTQHHLPEVSASVTQRNKVLEGCLATYAEFRRNLGAWTLSYPQHLDLEQVAVFLDSLNNVEEAARNSIKNRPTPTHDVGRSGRQLFETEDDQLLIGVATTDNPTRQNRFTLQGVDGQTETWLPRSSGKYHLSQPAGSTQSPLPTDVMPLLTEARKRLADVGAYQSKVEGYARQDMLPIDLEHMMNSEAAELTTRAQAIERLSPTDPVIQQLNTKARELKSAGRTLRMQYSMKSKTPTEGYLDYLVEQGVVETRKEGVLRELGKRPDGRKDFLQEYVVLDLVSLPPKPLWYAHFHYTSANPRFDDFVKGHLKLPAQRNLGLKWQETKASSGAAVESIWRGDIGKPLGNKHFSGL
ncbi:dermonecrotic toxin domain-containing protein [Pseudomonas sp. 18173]|uniref:dermonecrotic toxin domain-containing protein n=1 Tax=Pseudomonas sp. 18173 TaxID=3390055 RepID=UPI003D1DA4DA